MNNAELEADKHPNVRCPPLSKLHQKRLAAGHREKAARIRAEAEAQYKLHLRKAEVHDVVAGRLENGDFLWTITEED